MLNSRQEKLKGSELKLEEISLFNLSFSEGSASGEPSSLAGERHVLKCRHTVKAEVPSENHIL